MSYVEGFSASKTQNLSPNLSFDNDLSEIKQINQSLGIDGKDVLLNYNPGLAWWKKNQLTSEPEIRKWREYEKFQVETALRERNHAAKSSVTYTLDEKGFAYNPLFPDEPFINVLARGYAYRKENGSTELEREQAEIDGWDKVITVLSDPDTPEHTKAIVISGSGIVQGTAYKANFVDVYEAINNHKTGQREVTMVRHASSLNYEQYLQKAQTLGQKESPTGNEPIDAWFLSHPIFKNAGEFDSASEIFHHFFECNRKLMNEKDFRKVLQMTMPVINYYLNILSKATFDPEEIAISWNAVLNKNDDSVELLEEMNKVSIFYEHKPLEMMSQSIYPDLRQEVYALGRKEVKQVAAGCGSSSGLKTNSDGLKSNPIESLMENSVAKFGKAASSESSTLKPGDENNEGWVNDCGHSIPWEENVDDPSTWKTHCKCGAKLRTCK